MPRCVFLQEQVQRASKGSKAFDKVAIIASESQKGSKLRMSLWWDEAFNGGRFLWVAVELTFSQKISEKR